MNDLEPHLAEIAYSRRRRRSGRAARAVEYSVRAGDRAAAVLAYEDSARQYERALMLLAPSEATSAQRAEILLRLGDAGRARATLRPGDVRGSCGDRSTRGRSRADGRGGLGYARVLEPVQLGLGGILITAQTARPARSRCSRTRSRRSPKATAHCVLEHSRPRPSCM